MNEKERFLSENGYYVSTPSGSSMRPFIRGGLDVVTVLPITAPPCLFDAVLYRRKNGEHVIHRIVAVKKDCYLIRGDNCYYTERVAKDSVIGVVHTVCRAGKDLLADTRRYRFLAGFWHVIYPVRYLFHGAVRVFRRIKRLLFGKRNKNKTL
jgi:hypothetical protein